MTKRKQRGRTKHSDTPAFSESNLLLAESHHDLTKQEGRSKAVGSAEYRDDDGNFMRVVGIIFGKSTMHLDTIVPLDYGENDPWPENHNNDAKEEEEIVSDAFPASRSIRGVGDFVVSRRRRNILAGLHL
jgi:hypothetical protein